MSVTAKYSVHGLHWIAHGTVEWTSHKPFVVLVTLCRAWSSSFSDQSLLNYVKITLMSRKLNLVAPVGLDEVICFFQKNYLP